MITFHPAPENYGIRFVRSDIKDSPEIRADIDHVVDISRGTTIEENMTYPVIKSGIIHLSKQMSSFYGKYHVRVNTVCPGGLKGIVAGKNVKQDLRFIKKYIKKTPLRRMTNPEDVAYAILFLSSEASSYITGHALNVDGGLSKLFLKYSWKTATSISFGIQYSSLFGNQFIDNKLYTYEVEIDTIADSENVINEIPLDWVDDIVISDDCSTDNTYDIIKKKHESKSPINKSAILRALKYVP